MSNSVACPICTGANTTVDRELYDDRYGYPGTFELHACGGCGHRWLAVDLDPEALYREHYPPRSHTTRARVSPSSAAAFVPPNVSVLDIGCGAGDALAYHRTRGCTVRGVEADANAVAAARAAGLAVDHGAFAPTTERFDVVTLDQVLEHFAAPVAILRQIHAVCDRLIVATPNARGAVARVAGGRWIHWHAPYHVQFFTRDSLVLAATTAGFTVDDIRTVTDPNWLSYQWIHALTRPRVGQRSRLWTARHPLRALRHLGIERAITRLCDRFDVGDNFVAVLRA